MACARNLGLSPIPIVAVSVDGYYDAFRQMLDRSYKDHLIKNKPEDVVHFVSTGEEAVKWVEEQGKVKVTLQDVQQRESALQGSSSFMGGWFRRAASSVGASFLFDDNDQKERGMVVIPGLLFATGLALGFVVGTRSK